MGVFVFLVVEGDLPSVLSRISRARRSPIDNKLSALVFFILLEGDFTWTSSLLCALFEVEGFHRGGFTCFPNAAGSSTTISSNRVRNWCRFIAVRQYIIIWENWPHTLARFRFPLVLHVISQNRKILNSPKWRQIRQQMICNKLIDDVTCWYYLP